MNRALAVFVFLSSFLFLTSTGCKKDATTASASTSTTTTTNSSELETYLKSTCTYVHKINGFYIVSTNEKPSSQETTPGTTAKEIFDHSVKLFSNFLDQNEDGMIDPDKKALSDGLAKHMLFISGHLKLVNKVSEAPALRKKNLYAMSMQTDNWPYLKPYNGKGWSISKLNSSTWRPANFNALWEETFHTITEAYSRYDPEFKFTVGGKLRKWMDDEIASKAYDISVQNAEENGNYDRVTAVNEYIHQIWAIQFAGQENKLTPIQKKVLLFMKNKGVPMKLNPNYDKTIGTRIK